MARNLARRTSARSPVLTDDTTRSAGWGDSSLNRIEKTLAFIDRDGLGLEVGPAHSPIAPRRAGFNVHVLDYMDANALREKFRNVDVNLSQIEEVDFVWKGERLPELVGGTGRYDWIIASHVIEHLPDLAGFLIDCQDLLKPEGVVSLVIPDKRYCFDCFRPLTTTGEILDAFGQARNRPSPGSVFENFANCVTLDGEISWSAGASGNFESPYSFEVAQGFWGQATAGEYVDVHVSRFTPAGFRLIMQDLKSLGLLRLEVAHEFETTGNEFFVTLSQGATRASAMDRVAILRMVESELAEAIQDESIPEEPPEVSTPTLAVSPREESMILFKRRMMDQIRRTFRFGADRQSGRG
jgi:SAM-dependent methyltransferase